MKKDDLPTQLAVFPLSNFIIFPKTTVPLNIFEQRYIEMINDSMKSNKLIGMIQPRILDYKNSTDPELHHVGCMGKITSFKETADNRYLIELKGIIRFQIINEVRTNKKYRECEINFENFYGDFEKEKRDIKNLIKIAEKRINLGLELDSSVCLDFEKYNKHKNFLFAKGIDFIYEFFNLENRINNNIISYSVKFLGKNKTTNNFLTKFADKGFQFLNY